MHPKTYKHLNRNLRRFHQTHLHQNLSEFYQGIWNSDLNTIKYYNDIVGKSCNFHTQSRAHTRPIGRRRVLVC